MLLITCGGCGEGSTRGSIVAPLLRVSRRAHMHSNGRSQGGVALARCACRSSGAAWVASLSAGHCGCTFTRGRGTAALLLRGSQLAVRIRLVSSSAQARRVRAAARERAVGMQEVRWEGQTDTVGRCRWREEGGRRRWRRQDRQAGSAVSHPEGAACRASGGRGGEAHTVSLATHPAAGRARAQGCGWWWWQRRGS